MDGIDGINAGMDHVGISLSNGTKTSSENIQLNGRGTCLSYDPQTARLCCTWLCGHRSWRHIWLKISSTVSHSVRKRIVSQSWRRKSEGGTESCGDFCIMRGPSDWRGQWDWNRPILPFTGSPGPSPSLSRTHAFGPLHDSLVLSLLLSIYIYICPLYDRNLSMKTRHNLAPTISPSHPMSTAREKAMPWPAFRRWILLYFSFECLSWNCAGSHRSGTRSSPHPTAPLQRVDKDYGLKCAAS